MDDPKELMAAIEYAKLGWSVMSLCPHNHLSVGKEHHRVCKSPGKAPYFPNTDEWNRGKWTARQTERATEEEIRGWWSLGHELNVGVALGPVSGIVGIDIDDADGETLLNDLSAGDIPRTWEYTTGKGRRLIYRLPEGVHVRSVPFTRIGTKVEILRFMGERSQIVLPPSTHPSGAKYRWESGKSPSDIEAATVPEWMIAKHVEVKAERLNDGELISEGGRHNFLTSLAGTIRKHGAHEDVIYAAIAKMNEDRCNPPMSDEEVRTIARSMNKYETDEWSGVTIKQPNTGGDRDATRRFQWFNELQMPEKADEWIWKGYLPRAGIVLMSALWKAGKTTLMSHLLKALGSDCDFLGQTIKASKVLYVSEEAVQHWVKRRDQLGIGNYAALYSQPFMNKTTMDQWQEFILQLKMDVETHGFDLVVIDTLAKMWPVRDENNSVDVDSALMPLHQITKAGAGVLLIHHMRKSGGAEYTGSRGSGALSAFPDIVMEMVRFDALDMRCNKRILKAKGRYDETPDELTIELVNGNYQAIITTTTTTGVKSEGQKLTVTGDSEEARVLSILTKSPDPWLTADEIRSMLKSVKAGIRSEDVVTHLWSLYGRSLVVTKGTLRSKKDPKVYALASRDDLIPSPSDPDAEPDGDERDGDG